MVGAVSPRSGAARRRAAAATPEAPLHAPAAPPRRPPPARPARARRAARALAVAALACALAAGGCRPGDRADAEDALDAAATATRRTLLTGDLLERALVAPRGVATEEAAAALAASLAKSLDCAAVSAEGATVTVDLGDAASPCLLHGEPRTGLVAFTVEESAADAVRIRAAWTDLSDGAVKIAGESVITWDGGADRLVSDDLRWGSPGDDLTAPGVGTEGSGGRVQRPLADGTGLEIPDGEEGWSDLGSWTVGTLDAVVRWTDRVPEAGRHTVVDLLGRTFVLDYARRSDTTIRVTVDGPDRTWTFSVVDRSGG